MSDFRMRAGDTVLAKRVYWVNAGQPGTGSYIEGDAGNLVDVVQIEEIAAGDPGTANVDWQTPLMTPFPASPLTPFDLTATLSTDLTTATLLDAFP